MLRVLCGWKTGSGRTPFTGLCRSSRGAESEGKRVGGRPVPFCSQVIRRYLPSGRGEAKTLWII